MERRKFDLVTRARQNNRANNRANAGRRAASRSLPRPIKRHEMKRVFAADIWSGVPGQRLEAENRCPSGA